MLFDGISEENLASLKTCLNAVKKTYLKGEIIYNYGDTLTSVGYILSGKVQIIKDDYENNKIIISEQKENETFAESLVCSGLKESNIIVVASVDTEVLFIDFKRILSVCNNSCQFHKQLIENVIRIIAKKNVFLNTRIELLTKQSLREKIKMYLGYQKQNSNKDIFEIPFSREEMASFLGVNRSALSRELSKMKEENIIDFHKNSFKLNV